MARERSTDRPRTRWTDGNGRLHDEFAYPWHRSWLREFSRAGLSPKALHPSGCEVPVMGDGWDISSQGTGCVTDLLYVMSRLNRGLTDSGDPHRDNALDVLMVMDRFLAIGEFLGLGESYRSVVARLTHEVIVWRRMLFYVPNGLPLPDAELEAAYAGDDSGMAGDSPDSVAGEWGCPSGVGHDDHGHGKSPLGWVCLQEEHDGVDG